MASVEELIERIRDSSDFKERVTTLQELAQIVGPDDAEALAFINKIASYNLFTGLAPYGKKVISHLKKKYPDLYREQLPRDSRFEEELNNLQSSDFRERLRVLEYFEAEGINKAVPHLLKLIEIEDHPWVISKLTKTTGLLGATHNNEQIFNVLLGYLEHEDDRIRANTIEGIGGLKSKNKLPVLLDMMMKDSSERVKQMASIAISFDDTVRALELIKVMLDSDDLEMATNALDVLKRFDWLEADTMYQQYRKILHDRLQTENFQSSGFEYDPVEDDPELFNFDFDQTTEATIEETRKQQLDDFLSVKEEPSVQQEDAKPPEESNQTIKPKTLKKKLLIKPPKIDSSRKLETKPSIPTSSESKSRVKITEEKKPVEFTNTENSQVNKVRIQRSDPVTSKLLQDILFQIKRVEENAEKRAIDVENELTRVRKISTEGKSVNTKPSIPKRIITWSILAAVFVLYFNFEDEVVRSIHRFNAVYQAVSTGKIQQKLNNVSAPPVKIAVKQENPFANFDQIEFYNKSETNKSSNDSTDISTSQVVVKTPQATETDDASLVPTLVTSETKSTEVLVAKTEEGLTNSNQISKSKTSTELTDVQTEAILVTDSSLKNDIVTRGQMVAQVDKTSPEVNDTIMPSGKPPKNGTYKFIYSNDDKYIGSFVDYKKEGSGTMIFANGEIYSGEWKADKFHGQGSLTWANGDKYEGSFENGLRHGEGILAWINGERFKGSFIEGKRNGYGVMQYSNGESYAGDWQNDTFNGIGIYTFSNGAKYDGDFKHGIREGQGSFIYSNGNEYTGTFADGKRSGEGIYKLQNGERFEGSFENDKYQGDGSYQWVNGDRYEGEWHQGQMHGDGKYTWANGDYYEGQYVRDQMSGIGILSETDGRYEGQFLNGLKHGEGVYVSRNGYTYAGDWKDGQKSGYGESKWPDGEGYSGEWQNDLEHGMGRYLWSDGHKYVGQFYKGLKQGMGTFIWSDGQVQEGLWNEDIFVGKKVQTDRLSRLEKQIIGMVEKEMNLQLPVKDKKLLPSIGD